MAIGRREDIGPAIRGGAIAGVAGGVALSIFMAVSGAIKGQDFWIGTKMSGAPFLGDRAMQPGFDAGAVFVGVLSHFAVSVIWGVLFAIIAWGASKSATIIAGIFYGVVVWLGMFYVVLPIAGLAEMANSMPAGVAILEHLIFGAAVGLGFLPFQRVQLAGSHLPAGAHHPPSRS